MRILIVEDQSEHHPRQAHNILESHAFPEP